MRLESSRFHMHMCTAKLVPRSQLGKRCSFFQNFPHYHASGPGEGINRLLTVLPRYRFISDYSTCHFC